MNDRDRDSFERILSSMAGVKQELVALTQHVERQNGSIVKHFDGDLAWQRKYDMAAATAQGFRKGLMWPLAPLLVVTSIVGPALVRLALGG